MKKQRFVVFALAALCGVAILVANVLARQSGQEKQDQEKRQKVAEESARSSDAPQGAAASPAKTAQVVSCAPAVGIAEPQARRYAGKIVSIEEVDVVPRVTGWIEKINFKEGDFVKEGDLLFEIEDATYQIAVRSATANLAQAEAELKNAETNFKRAKNLFEKQAGSEADYDDAQQRLAQADAALAGRKAALDDARNTLSYTRVSSPISGRVGKVLVTRGNLVSPQTGKLVDVKSFSPIYVKFAIGESVFRTTFGGEKRIRELAQIRLGLVGNEIYPEKAQIELIDNKVDSGTNTVVLWAKLENADGQLFPGSYATVLLSKKTEKPLVGVLLSAVQTDGKENFVWILDQENRAERRPVKLGAISGKYNLIDEGVQEGETIVVDGMNKLKPGAIAEPVPFDGENDAAATEAAPPQADAEK